MSLLCKSLDAGFTSNIFMIAHNFDRTAKVMFFL